MGGSTLISLLRAFLADAPDRATISNGGFIVATTAVGSVAGFVFWIVAARAFPIEEVGLGAAYISAATLVAAIAELGLGTAIIRFGHTQRRNLSDFVNSSLLFVSGAGLLVAIVFAVGSPLWTSQLTAVQAGVPLLIFASTASSFALAQMFDRIFVAFETGSLLLIRNASAHLVRLGALGALVLLWVEPSSTALLLPMLAGSVATAGLCLAVLLKRADSRLSAQLCFRWSLLRPVVPYALRNHASVLFWTSPALLYPLIVVNVLGPEAGAQFYISWMIANLVLVIPTAAATAAFARASRLESWDFRIFLSTTKLVIAVLILPVAVLLIFNSALFSLFGPPYQQVDILFPLLLLAAFPFATNSAALAFHRMSVDSLTSAWLPGVITLMCLGLSTALGANYGLAGFGAGWLVGQVAGVLIFAITLRATRTPNVSDA